MINNNEPAMVGNDFNRAKRHDIMLYYVTLRQITLRYVIGNSSCMYLMGWSFGWWMEKLWFGWLI